MPKQARQSKHWVFTINNPTDEDYPRTDNIAYMVFGREVGPGGTRHWQGYVCFKNRKRLSAVKKIFPRAHLEIKGGTIREAIDYCMKDGDYDTFGEEPVTALEATKSRWAHAIACAKVGDFDGIPDDMLMRYYHGWKRLFQDNPIIPADLLERDNKWIVAPSGYGKSTYAREMYPDFFDKAPNKWYIGYKNQTTILLDDWGPKQCEYLGWYMKRWGDTFPYPAETKGGGMMIRPEHIVVTSQYTIEECFEDDELIREAIMNRFQVIRLEHWKTRCTLISDLLDE